MLRPRRGRLASIADWLLLLALVACVMLYGLALSVWLVPHV
jgi:hypothetical protein